MNGDELLAKIQPKLKEVRVQVCMRPDLIDQWHELDAELRTEQARAGGRLNDVAASTDSKRIAKKQQAVEAEIEESSIWFTFRALTKAAYEALCAEHPPRKDNQFDVIRGHNVQAVGDSLVRASLVDPVFTDEGWLNLQASLAQSMWDALVEGSNEANGGLRTPPKSELASRVLTKRGSGSE